MTVYFCALPPEILGVFVFAMLEGPDLARLECSAVPHNAPLREAYKYAAPVAIPAYLKDQIEVWNWCWRRKLRIQEVTLHVILLLEHWRDKFHNEVSEIEAYCVSFRDYEIMSARLFETDLAGKVSTLRIDDAPGQVGFVLHLSLRNLRSLIYEGGDISPQSQRSLCTVLNENPSMQSISIDASGTLGAQFYQALAQRGPTLTELTFLRVQMTPTELALIGSHCPSLRKLVLRPGSQLRRGEGLLAVAVGCPLLEEVTFDEPEMGEALLLTLAQNCPHLRRLSLARSVLSTPALRAFAVRCRHLTHLSITWGLTGPKEATARLFAQLQSFAVYCSDTNTDSLARAVGCMKNVRQLQVRDIASKHVSVVQAAGKACTLLQSLSITCVAAYALPGLHTALTGVIRKNPRLSNLEFHVWDSAFPLYETVRRCTALATLDVSGAVGLEGHELAWLAEACPRLRRLRGIAAGKGVSDHAVLALAQHCPFLREVDLTACAKVTEAALVQLVAQCRRLEMLTVHPQKITGEAVRRINATATAMHVPSPQQGQTPLVVCRRPQDP